MPLVSGRRAKLCRDAYAVKLLNPELVEALCPASLCLNE